MTDFSSLNIQQSRQDGVFDEPQTETEVGLPRIVYTCTSDLFLTNISDNAFELMGIRPENLINNRCLWEERILREDLTRISGKLNHLGLTEMGCDVHKISNDQGLPVWVIHHFRKLKINCETTILGCMSPLESDFWAQTVDARTVAQFVHKIGNHFQLMNLLVGSLKRASSSIDEIEALQQNMDRAVEFTRSFSQFCLPPTGATAVDLADLLDAAIAAAGACLEEKVTIQNLVQKSLNGACTIGDAFLLELAFGAILKNAIEATKSGDHICVTAMISNGPATQSIARITIVDTGCGIEIDALPTATAPFVSSKRDRDGLGLSTAVRVIEMHGGNLKISSAPGQGTQIFIALPVELNPTEPRL